MMNPIHHPDIKIQVTAALGEPQKHTREQPCEIHVSATYTGAAAKRPPFVVKLLGPVGLEQIDQAAHTAAFTILKDIRTALQSRVEDGQRAAEALELLRTPEHGPVVDAGVFEELHNIAKNGPVFAGDVISHTTADECARRGWATRDGDGKFVLTGAGAFALAEAPAPWTMPLSEGKATP